MGDLPTNFANFPKSIGELRSDQQDNGALWSPRDALIDVLRDLDEGKIKTSALVVIWSEEGGDHEATNYRNASKSILKSIGLMAQVLFRFQMCLNED